MKGKERLTETLALMRPPCKFAAATPGLIAAGWQTEIKPMSQSVTLRPRSTPSDAGPYGEDFLIVQDGEIVVLHDPKVEIVFPPRPTGEHQA